MSLHYAVNVSPVTSLSTVVDIDKMLEVIMFLTNEVKEACLTDVSAIYTGDNFEEALTLYKWNEQVYDKHHRCQINMIGEADILVVIFFWIREDMLPLYYTLHKDGSFLLAPSQLIEKKRIEEEQSTMLGLTN
jgi:hypothetical protein